MLIVMSRKPTSIKMTYWKILTFSGRSGEKLLTTLGVIEQ